MHLLHVSLLVMHNVAHILSVFQCGGSTKLAYGPIKQTVSFHLASGGSGANNVFNNHAPSTWWEWYKSILHSWLHHSVGVL
jgi:hypothetical protein